MDAKDLIALGGREVRRDSDLMTAYINAFQSYFGHKPNCAGCTFNKDFERLKRAVNKGNGSLIIKTKTMEKTFKLFSVKGEIFTYKVGKKVVRQYDNRMTEEFAIGFLTNGKNHELEERKKLFKKLPKSLIETKKEDEVKEEKPKVKRTKKEK